MTCHRGKASPNAHTQRKLFAASAGFCQNPDCSRELFIEYPEKSIHVAEMAHIFAANNDGPRADTQLSEEQRGAFENLILLCPLCHTKIDKAPEVYSDSLIQSWKRAHAEKLQALFGVRIFDHRHDARTSIESLLRENFRIFEDYGPHTPEANNPESGAAERWKRKVLLKIIPNNIKILTQLDANRHLLSDREMIVLDRFRQHIDDLQARHIEGYNEGASQFPPEMTNILKD